MSKVYICLGILVLASYTGCEARRAQPVMHELDDDDAELAEDSHTRGDIDQAAGEALAELYQTTARHAKWDGKRFVCPGGTWTWADEGEAIARRKDYVYCVPVREVAP